MVSLLLNSEFLVIILFCLFTNAAVLVNINFFFGVSLSFLILGGLEIALTLLFTRCLGSGTRLFLLLIYLLI